MRIVQRLVGLLLIILGVYLIFGAQEFFGTILIIFAFLIFPSLKSTPDPGSHDSNDDRTYEPEESNDSWKSPSSFDSSSDRD